MAAVGLRPRTIGDDTIDLHVSTVMLRQYLRTFERAKRAARDTAIVNAVRQHEQLLDRDVAEIVAADGEFLEAVRLVRAAAHQLRDQHADLNKKFGIVEGERQKDGLAYLIDAPIDVLAEAKEPIALIAGLELS